MEKNNYRIAMIVLMLSFAVSSHAQIIYSDTRLKINTEVEDNLYGLNIHKWQGMYWTCKTGNFFQLDVSPTNPRLAGTGDEIAFYNTETGVYNSIKVANVYNYSDARAKNDIQTLSSGLNSILNLRPVSFQWKSPDAENNMLTDSSDSTSLASGPKEEGLQYGFLAQEVEEVIPDIVKTDDSGHKMVNYTAIIPLLVQSVQELKAIVDIQNQKIEQLMQSYQNKNLQNIDGRNKIVSCSPNPSSGEVMIKTSLAEDVKSAYIIIRNLSGNEEKRMLVSDSLLTTDISNLDSGIHIVSLIVNGCLCDSSRLIKD